MLANQFKCFLKGLSLGRFKVARRRSMRRGFRASDSEKLENRQLLSAITVTSIADNTTSGDGQTTLREALIQANADPDHDTIDFSPALQGKTIHLTQGPLQVTSQLDINGPGARLLEINGSTLSTVFDVKSDSFGPNAGASNDVRIAGLAIADAGDASIINDGADLTLTELFISDSDGDGVQNVKSGIRTFGNLTVENSTIANNQGNGIYSDGGEVLVRQSTITGHRGVGFHGILNLGASDLTVESSTVAFNQNQRGSVDGTSTGGGIQTTSEATLRNTLLVGNQGQTRTTTSEWYTVIIGGRPVRLTRPVTNFTSTNSNVSGPADSVFTLNTYSSNVIETSLADNGGPVDTLAIAGNASPAVDRGNSFGAEFDQRGFTRSVDSEFVENVAGGDGTDIGAVEFGSQEAPRLSISLIGGGGAEGNSGITPFSFTVTRSGDVSLPGTVDWAVTGSGDDPADADDFGGVLPGGTVAFGAGEASKTVTIGWTGDRDFESDEGFQVTLSNASNGATISTATANGAILNDDVSPPPEALLTFSYQLVSASSGQVIGANDSLGPGDAFTLQVFARENVAGISGIGSLIVDIDFDESIVEPVNYSKSVVDSNNWSSDLTQTTIGSTGSDQFIDNLGVDAPRSLNAVLGNGVNVLVASIPLRVKTDLDLQNVTSTTIAGLDAFSRGNTGGLIVNSLADAGGTVINAADIDFGSISLSVQPFDQFDLNRDGSVNTADLSALRGQLLQKLNDDSYVIPDRFDVNDDGSINTGDLSAERGRLLSLLSGSQSARPASPVIAETPLALPAVAQSSVVARSGELISPNDIQVVAASLPLSGYVEASSANTTPVELDGASTETATTLQGGDMLAIDNMFTGGELETTLNALT